MWFGADLVRTTDITHLEPPNMAEEQFLATLRLEEEQRSKLEELPGAPVRDRDESYYAPKCGIRFSCSWVT